MSTTSKSPRRVALAALAVGRRTLPDYPHRFAPKTYTQPQLLACLVLMRFHKADFRGITAILQDNPTLCDALGLQRVPHFTTLHKACRRLIRRPVVRQLLSASAKLLLGRKRTIVRAAHHIVRKMNMQHVEMTRYFYKSSGRY